MQLSISEQVPEDLRQGGNEALVCPPGAQSALSTRVWHVPARRAALIRLHTCDNFDATG